MYVPIYTNTVDVFIPVNIDILYFIFYTIPLALHIYCLSMADHSLSA